MTTSDSVRPLTAAEEQAIRIEHDYGVIGPQECQTCRVLAALDEARAGSLDADLLTEAMVAAGLIQHGPDRLGETGAPIASVSPRTWGWAVVKEYHRLAALREAQP
jgi:hypothetical protein